MAEPSFQDRNLPAPQRKLKPARERASATPDHSPRPACIVIPLATCADESSGVVLRDPLRADAAIDATEGQTPELRRPVREQFGPARRGATQSTAPYPPKRPAGEPARARE